MEQDFTAIYRNLMAVGLLGTVYQAGDDAELINDIIDSTLAQPMQFRVCRSVVSGMAGSGEVAKDTLGVYVENHPDDEPACLALAISLILAGDEEGRRAVDRLLVTTTDPAVRQTAHEMLELIDSEEVLG